MIAALVYFQYEHRIHKSEAASSDIFFEEKIFFPATHSQQNNQAEVGFQ